MLRSLTLPAPVANSKPVRARDYSVELQHSGPATLPAIYHNFHLVAVKLGRDGLVVRDGPAGRSWARYVVGESSVHAAGPGERVTWPRGAYWLYVHLHPRLIRRIGQATLGAPGIVPRSEASLRDPVIREIGLELHDLIAARAPVAARAAHDLVMALAHHVTATYPAPQGRTVRVGTVPIEEILDAFRDEGPSWEGVAALAARCGLTRSHFSRRVRAITGLTPYAMVLGSRVEAAKHLLEAREASVAEVAYATGFADQSHLTRVFQRATGVTPARYRMARAPAARPGGA
jgi:AraC family transcriptional regulator